MKKKVAAFIREPMVDSQPVCSEMNIQGCRIKNLTKNISGGVHQRANDPSLTLLSMSDSFLSMFGYTRKEIKLLFQDQFINMIYPSDRAEVLRKVSQQLENGPDIELEYRVLCKPGQPVWILDKSKIFDDGMGGQCFYSLLVDINDRKKEQEELRLSLERHEVIMNQSTDIIFEWDISRDTLLFSQNWKKKFGYDPISQRVSGQIPLSKNIYREDIQAFVKIMKDTVEGVPYSEAEFRISNAEGRYLWCRIRATTQYDENRRPLKAVGVIIDIDEEKRQKQALLDQVQLDALTGLYNKAAVNALVENQIKKSSAKGMQVLFIIDVDRFKLVNDTYGHLCGDSILSDVASVIKNNIRTCDFAGRIGGDEFLVYLSEVPSEAAAHKKAETLLEAFRVLTPEVGAMPISCSIGGVIFPNGINDYFNLYKCADQALYAQKQNGRGSVTFYSPEMSDQFPCEFSESVVSTLIASDERNVQDEQLAQYAFHTLYAARDIEFTLNRLLEIIGRSYDVSRVYIFENSDDGTYCSNTFEWHSEGIPSGKDKLQNLSYKDLLDDYQKNFDGNGLFYCSDVRDKLSNIYELLEEQKIHSMLQCAMLDEGQFVGFVGFDECRNYRKWNSQQVASFKLTANVLSTFLIKLRQRQKLQKV